MGSTGWPRRAGLGGRCPLLAALIPFVIASCGDGDSTGPGDSVSNTNFEVSEEFSFEVEVGTQNRLQITGVNGRIEVFGDPAATSVTIEGERTVGSESTEDAEAHLPLLEVRVSSNANAVIVQTVQPTNTGGRNFRVDYDVIVPQTFRVDATDVNGDMLVSGINAGATVNNVNGSIEVADVVGNVVALLTNGNVDLEEVLGSATASTTNGRIEALITLPIDGTIDLATVNGQVDLDLPQNTSATLSASVVNCTITVQDLVVSGRTETPNSLNGTLGAGEGTITLATVNGDIVVSGF